MSLIRANEIANVENEKSRHPLKKEREKGITFKNVYETGPKLSFHVVWQKKFTERSKNTEVLTKKKNYFAICYCYAIVRLRAI